jgi:hypothetical protein
MRKVFGIDLADAIPFIVCAVVYVVLVFVWNLSGIANSNISFIRGVVPVIGDLPPQSISRFYVTVTLYILALIYALWSLLGSEYRRYLVQFVGLSVISFLAWVTLNYWVIAGFLNSPNTLLYGAITIVLLVLWVGGVMRFVAELHDPLALFMVRFGLGLTVFITIVQIASVLYDVVASLLPAGTLPLFEWRSPTNGIPILYTLTLNAIVGVFIAGVGGNMLWREKRTQMVAAAGKRR